MSTRGYGGRHLKKNARVITNDPGHSRIELSMAGQVEKLATVTPSRVNLRGAAGDAISQTVRIIPETKEPFQIVSARAVKGTDIRYAIKQVKAPEKGYELTVTNTREKPGRYYDRLVLKTDVGKRNFLSIIVIGTIMEKEKTAQ